MHTDDAQTDDYIYLLGRPPLADCLRFARSNAVDRGIVEDGTLVQEWRRANERIRDLEASEGGIADDPPLAPLPPEMVPFAERAVQSAATRRTMQSVPRRWHLIDLDRVIVYQKTINLRFASAVRASFPAKPEPEDLIRMAIGENRTLPKVRCSQALDRSFVFASTSNDLQFLDVVPIDPGTITGYEPSGHAVAAVVAYIGYGVNFINAFYANKRIVLSNGSHRAYALRELGITHVPCLVGDASREENFDLLAPPEVKQYRHHYLAAPRPPLLKDYFEPSLRTLIRTVRRNQLLQLQHTFNRIDAPVL